MEPSQHKRPIALGLLSATACPVAGLLAWAHYWPTSAEQWGGVLGLCLIALTGVFLFGLPIVLALRKYGRLTWAAVLVSAILAGNLYYQVLGTFLSDGFSLSLLPEGTLFGLIAGLGFCIGAGPNKSFKPNPLRGSA